MFLRHLSAACRHFEGILCVVHLYNFKILLLKIRYLGKIKKWTAARRQHVDPWRHWNVSTTSPCRISAYTGFSGSLFHVFSNLVENKENNPLFVWGLDIKVRPSLSQFVIPRQASWCKSMILWTDFSIPPSHSWWILIISHTRTSPWER